MDQSTDPLADLSPQTRELVEQIRTNEHLLKTPEFEHLGPPSTDGILATLCFTRACTSLTDGEATERINLANPSGLSHGWTLLTEEGNGGPVPCEDKPTTHRHRLMPVKPPTPLEPAVGAYMLGKRLCMRTGREPGKCHVYETGGMWAEERFEKLWEMFGGPDVTITRLVPERVETVPLPWTGRSQTGHFIFGVTPCRPGGRDAANVSIDDAMATITPSVAREMAAALLAFANGTAASRAES